MAKILDDLGFSSEVTLKNSTPTLLRISNKNRKFLDKLCKEFGNPSMNWMVNRILFCERKRGTHKKRIAIGEIK